MQIDPSRSVALPALPATNTDTNTDNVRHGGEQTSPAALLEQMTTATVAAVMGSSAPPNRDALRALIKANSDLIKSGDTPAMAASLARQATAKDATRLKQLNDGLKDLGLDG